MVTISAFAIVLLALAVFAYCEYHHYWQDDSDETGLAQPQEQQTGLDTHQQLANLTAQFEVENKNTVGLQGKFNAIMRFIGFVLFKSKEQKQERCRRNELTAEKLLLEYQALVRLPGNERVDRFIRWRDDVADYEERKKTENAYRMHHKES